MWSSAKISSVVCLFSVAFVSGVSSVVIISCVAKKLGMSNRTSRVIGIINCFTGGVFFATSILELLPEAREKVDNVLQQTDFLTKYPFAELLTGVGFLLVLILEHLMHMCLKATRKPNKPSTSRRDNMSEEISLSDANGNTNFSYKTLTNDSSSTFENRVVLQDSFKDFSIYDDPSAVANKMKHNSNNVPINTNKSNSHKDNSESNDSVQLEGRNTFSCQETSESWNLGNTRLSHKENSSVTNLRAVVFLTALSIHMIFDGIAIGLLRKDHKMWELVLVLSLHKILAFSTTGIKIFENLKSIKKSIILIFILAWISPAGVFVGNSFVSDRENITRDTLATILQGLATGTFLFVTFFEILQREFASDLGISKIMAVVLGFGVIALVPLVEHAYGADK